MSPSKPAQTTRPADARGAVSTGEIDELLDDTPTYPVHRRGRLEGIKRGRKARWGLALLVLMVPSSLWMVVRAYQRQILAHRFDIPFAAPRPSADEATLHWDEGQARLGLHRDGVLRILVPDAVITLAPGQVHAQVWVNVQNGRLTRVKEVVGKVKVNSVAR